MSLLQEGKGTDEAIENRNYLAKRMTDEISEVILFPIHLHIDEWIWSSLQLQVMRILEESAQTDNSGKIVNGMNGLNLTDMTFHEVAMTMRKKIGSIFVAGDKEDQPSAGRVRGCWSLSSTRQSPRSTWLQGDTNPINYEPTSLSVNILILLCWAGFRGLWRSNQDRVAWSWQWAGSGELPTLNHHITPPVQHDNGPGEPPAWVKPEQPRIAANTQRGRPKVSLASSDQHHCHHMISTIICHWAIVNIKHHDHQHCLVPPVSQRLKIDDSL